MDKRRVNYAGNIVKHGFPMHKQEHDMSCGPACLRMLAEWSTRQSQSEYDWRERSKWNVKDGLPLEEMETSLVHVPGLRSYERPVPQAQKWDHSAEPPKFSDDSVYLLFTDSHGYDGENVKHWIVLLNIFDAKDKEKDGSPRKLALYADPLYDVLSVWPWRSLLAVEVRDGFHIVRRPPDDAR